MIIAPLSVPNFRRLLAGQGISTFGDAFFAIALPYQLLTSGQGTAALGLVLASAGVARLVTMLLGGLLSDRLGSRQVMLWSDILRGALMAVLAALVFRGTPPLWEYVALGVLLSACGGIFLPASGAMLPAILTDDALQAGNALWGTGLPLATLIGSAVAGIVVSHVAAGYAFAIDTGSYVISVLSLLGLQSTPAKPMKASAPVEVQADAKSPLSFWGYLRSSRLIQVTLVIVLISNLVDGGLEGVALPVLALGPFHAGALGYGVLVAVYSASALLGGLLAGMIRMPAWRGSLVVALLLGDGVGMTLLPYLGDAKGAAIALGIWGLANGLRDVWYYTLIQQIIPRHLLGRLMGVILFVTFGVYPLSVVVIGVGVGWLGPAAVFPIGGVVMLVACLLGLSQREIREA